VLDGIRVYTWVRDLTKMSARELGVIQPFQNRLSKGGARGIFIGRLNANQRLPGNGNEIRSRMVDPGRLWPVEAALRSCDCLLTTNGYWALPSAIFLKVFSNLRRNLTISHLVSCFNTDTPLKTSEDFSVCSVQCAPREKKGCLPEAIWWFQKAANSK